MENFEWSGFPSVSLRKPAGQQSVWDHRNPAGSNDRIFSPEQQFTVRVQLRGTLDPDALRSTLQVALARHDIALTQESVSSAQAKDIANEETGHPVDLSSQPVRARLLHLADRTAILLLTCHEAICDRHSLALLLRDTFARYRAWVLGEEGLPASTEFQYARQIRRGAVAPTSMPLPTDRRRPEQPGYSYGEVQFDLSASEVRRIRDLGHRHDTSFDTAFLAGWCALLARWTGSTDVVVCGFGNAVLTIDVSDDPTAAHLVMRTAAALRQARSIPSMDGTVPGLQVQVDVNDPNIWWRDLRELQIPDIELQAVTVSSERTRHELAIRFSDSSAGAKVTLEYARELFDETSIVQLADSWRILVEAMTAGPATLLSRLRLITTEQRRQVVEAFNATSRAYPEHSLIQELFEVQAKTRPHSMAIIDGSSSVSYAQLDWDASRLAAYLRAQGVRSGDYVPILLSRSISMVVAQLAVLKCGGVYVPLDPSVPPDRIGFTIEDCGARHVLADAALGSIPGRDSVQWIDCAKAIDEARPSEISTALSPRTSTDAAYVMYTSGSTGVPKGVVVSHRAVIRLVINSNYAEIGASDCIGHCSNPAFDASTFEIWGALLNGARLCVIPQSVMLETESFAATLRSHGVSALFQTTALFNQHVLALPTIFAPLKYVLFGGEACDPNVVRKVLNEGPPENLVHVYGPTETTTFATACVTRFVEEGARSVPIGAPIANTRVYILDRHLESVPIGVVGEIHIGGPGVALGYLNRAELTEKHFIPDQFSDTPADRLYKTGDLARWRSDGMVEFVGRNDGQVKLRGFRIELGEIEAQLLRLPEVKEAAVIAREDFPGERRLAAYVVPDLAKLKAVQPTRVAADAIVSQWKTLYEDTYSTDDQGPSFVGWNSSYTRQAIPEVEMREWRQTTLERIRSLKPSRILEIGCGVGLLLEHLAPECELYRGTDFSAEALARLKEWMARRPELQHVQLDHCAAHELGGVSAGTYDLVILNSVVQYFPNGEYLQQLLARAAHWLAPGGHIFVGDVRHLGLLNAFHSSVQLARADGHVTIRDLRSRVLRAVDRDKELVIDPRFFSELLDRSPGFAGVQVWPKQGSSENELTRYRYDVLLEAGEPQASINVPQWHWDTSMSVEEVANGLRADKPQAVCLRNVINSRVYRDCLAARWIEAGGETGTAEELRAKLEEQPCAGEHPDRFRALGSELGYDVEITWCRADDEGKFDVVFNDAHQSRAQLARAPHREQDASSAPVRNARQALTNDPLARNLRQQMIPRLLDHLKVRLPSYMVPSAVVVLDKMPLTFNGKLDRRALPAPDILSVISRQFEAPIGANEERLASIWRELLRVEPIGRRDNFFELGGHSLLIVQMIERLRCAGLLVDMKHVYDSRTLADLAATLEVLTDDEVEVPDNGIPSDCELIQPSMVTLVDLDAQQIESIVKRVPGGTRNIQDIYPLAPLQEGILFHHLLDDTGGDIYVRPMLFELPTEASVDELIGGLQAVIARHDILRTAILWEGLPRPVQVVYRRADLPVERMILDPNGDAMSVLRQLMELRHQRLDLQTAPLIRMEVHANPQDSRRYVLLQIHHAICDHQSLMIMREEVSAAIAGRAHELPAPMPYRDHVAHVQAHARTLDAEAFFRAKLGDVDEPSAPFGLLDVHGDGSRIDEASLTLQPELARGIRERARQNGVSAATLFHAAWALIVARTTGRDDVVFGTVLLGRLRGRAGAQRVLGMFINTLPLRVRPSGLTVQQLVEHTQRELVELLDHEQAGLAMAQRCSRVHGSAPLFTTLLNYLHSASVLSTTAPRIGQGVQIAMGQEWTNYPVVLSIDDQGEAFSLSVQTDRRLNPHRILGYLQKTLCSLVDALDDARDSSALALAILPEEERRQLTEEFNRSQIVFPKHKAVHEMFEEQARRTPDTVAVTCGARSMTFTELNRKANQLARYLKRHDVGPDDLVAVYMERSLELIVSMLGILKAGGAYLPLDPRYPQARLSSMLEDAAPKLVLDGYDPVSLRDEPDSNLDATEVRLQPGHLAYVIYTSGSTGVPKGVMVEHRNLVNLVQWHCHAFQLRSGSRTSCLASLGFDAATWEIWPPLCIGATLVLAPPQVAGDVDALLEWWAREHLDISFLPTPIAELAFSRNLQHDTLSTLLVGGDRLRSQPDIRRFALVNNYGPTECTVVATSGPIDVGASVPHIGRPIANAQIHILDPHRRLVPIGAAGEIYIGGAGVARGYLNRPDLTEVRFVHDPFSSDARDRLYRTGDLARWREDGTIEYLGRNDQQVKIRGFRIELGEIEARLLRHERIDAAAVILHEVTNREPRLIAYVVPKAGAGDTVDATLLRRYLKDALPEYMVPHVFVVLQSMPLTANGKVDRRALLIPEGDEGPDGGYEEPQGKLETALAEIWQEVLRIERVGRLENFFERGGHSLLATRVASGIRERLKVELPLRALFDAPTVAELAAFIAQREELQAIRPALVAQPRAARLPLSFAQERLWFLSQLGLAGAAYNVFFALRLAGTVDEPALQKSLTELVRRHESLRTRFGAENGVPHQLIDPAAPFDLQRLDLSVIHDGEGRENRLRGHIHREQLHEFDLSKGPLLRVVLVRLSVSEHALLLTFHHIVFDGWSVGVLVKELSALYAAFARRESNPLQEPSLQYADYAIWQRRWLEGEVLQGQLGYWRKQLEGAPTTLPLPTDHPRPDVATFQGEMVRFVLPAHLCAALERLARSENATLFMVFLAAYQLLIARYCGQEDIVVGSPIAGRTHGGTEGLIGFFVNTVVLRTDLSGNPTFRELVHRVKAVTLESYAHQDLPFEKLVSELRPERSLSHQPLFQVALALQNAPHEQLDLAGVSWTPIVTEHATAVFDMTLHLYETSDALLGATEGIRGELEYATDLFERSTIERIAAHFGKLLEMAAADPDRPLG